MKTPNWSHPMNAKLAKAEWRPEIYDGKVYISLKTPSLLTGKFEYFKVIFPMSEFVFTLSSD